MVLHPADEIFIGAVHKADFHLGRAGVQPSETAFFGSAGTLPSHLAKRTWHSFS